MTKGEVKLAEGCGGELSRAPSGTTQAFRNAFFCKFGGPLTKILFLALVVPNYDHDDTDDTLREPPIQKRLSRLGELPLLRVHELAIPFYSTDLQTVAVVSGF